MEFEYYRFGVQFLCAQFDTSTYLRVTFDWFQFYFCKNALTSMSLHQNVPHGFEVLFFIIWRVRCFVPICLEVFRLPSCTKVDSRITAVAMLSLVGNYADSCFRVKTVTDSIETGRSAPSTRHDLMTCHGIVRQRSVNKESSPVFG